MSQSVTRLSIFTFTLLMPHIIATKYFLSDMSTNWEDVSKLANLQERYFLVVDSGCHRAKPNRSLPQPFFFKPHQSSNVYFFHDVNSNRGGASELRNNNSDVF